MIRDSVRSILLPALLTLAVGCGDMSEDAGGEELGHAVDALVHNVSNRDELLRALKDARDGDVIRIRSSATINLTGHSRLRIPNGVTLDGGRRLGKGGALLVTRSFTGLTPLFIAKRGVRFRGMRLQGPSGLRGPADQPTDRELALALRLEAGGGDNEISDCHFFDWPYAAIRVVSSTNNWIHHNKFRRMLRNHRGYGVVLSAPFPANQQPSPLPRANALIEKNFFNYVRHAVAGTGFPGESYEARYNVVGSTATGHTFDMHGLGERPGFEGRPGAGRRIHIHHNNIFQTSDFPVVIRGRPSDRATINNNCVAGGVVAIQTRHFGNFVARDNLRWRSVNTCPSRIPELVPKVFRRDS